MFFEFWWLLSPTGTPSLPRWMTQAKGDHQTKTSNNLGNDDFAVGSKDETNHSHSKAVEDWPEDDFNLLHYFSPSRYNISAIETPATHSLTVASENVPIKTSNPAQKATKIIMFRISLSNCILLSFRSVVNQEFGQIKKKGITPLLGLFGDIKHVFRLFQQFSQRWHFQGKGRIQRISLWSPQLRLYLPIRDSEYSIRAHSRMWFAGLRRSLLVVTLMSYTSYVTLTSNLVVPNQ